MLPQYDSAFTDIMQKAVYQNKLWTQINYTNNVKQNMDYF